MPAHLFPVREEEKKAKRSETAEEDGSGSSESRPETPLGHLLPTIPFSPLRVRIPGRRQSIPESVLSTYSDPTSSESVDIQTIPEPPSPTFSTTSISTDFTSFTSASEMSTLSASTAATSVASSSSSGNLTIKAAHNQSIILIRTSRDAQFSDVRQRIFDKFLVQEKFTLSAAFAIAFVMPDSSNTNTNSTSNRVYVEAETASPGPKNPSFAASAKGKGRARSNSDSVTGSMQYYQNPMILVRNQADWERALASAFSSKVTVRVLDTFS
ncbi:hypothetical protein D9757_002492 [Collybiopsis confluens]|uniref:Uncharacterized protein n=1 Tax=Collybiopsis confluens TaxID=2823264 RepID=A0A8H5HXQ1_9AGAR|nr:hypothetical protein D9757_002492 [Collybiopsis confluens]